MEPIEDVDRHCQRKIRTISIGPEGMKLRRRETATLPRRRPENLCTFGDY